VTDDIHAVLQENLEGMRKSLAWLKRSHEKCSRIGTKQRYTEDEFDDFENVVSRYARTLAAILNKVFRSIDAVELDGGTLLDVVNRAEKRGIVDSAERVRDLKDLRNDIVDESETDDLRALHWSLNPEPASRPPSPIRVRKSFSHSRGGF